MKTITFTESERLKVTAAVSSMMHYHEQMEQKAKTDNHPTIAKRYRMEADEYKQLLEKLQ